MAFEPIYVEGLEPTDIEKAVTKSLITFTADERDQITALLTTLLGGGHRAKAQYDGTSQNPVVSRAIQKHLDAQGAVNVGGSH